MLLLNDTLADLLKSNEPVLLLSSNDDSMACFMEPLSYVIELS